MYSPIFSDNNRRREFEKSERKTSSRSNWYCQSGQFFPFLISKCNTKKGQLLEYFGPLLDFVSLLKPLQEPVLFDGNLFENIAMGAESVTHEQIMRACELVCSLLTNS